MAATNNSTQSEFELDPAILDVLPKESKVSAVEEFSASSWASTAKIDTEAADGSQKQYFLKIVRAPDGAARVLGEYMSMSEIYKTAPDFAPQPHGYGKCRGEDAHFFLCDFLVIDQKKMPDPARLGKKLADLHHNSESPTSKFGFHCVTFDGKLPLNMAWDASWTSFFTKLMRDVYKLDKEFNGFWKPLDDVMQITFKKLIPRLLGPLTAEGRTIKPCLIHGDHWESNIGTDTQTGEISIFDSCAYYAHHEKEVGIWRCEHHNMHDEIYRNEYFKNYPPSEPIAESDERNRLYSVETLLIHSAHFPGSETRNHALKELSWLINKYSMDMGIAKDA